MNVEKVAKFLGILSEEHALNNTYREHKESKGRKRFNHLKTMCGRKYRKSPQTVFKVYISYIRSLFKYTLPAWITASPLQINWLLTIQNIAITIPYRLPRYPSNHYTHNISGLSQSLVRSSSTEPCITHYWRKLWKRPNGPQTHPCPKCSKVETDPTYSTIPT